MMFGSTVTVFFIKILAVELDEEKLFSVMLTAEIISTICLILLVFTFKEFAAQPFRQTKKIMTQSQVLVNPI